MNHRSMFGAVTASAFSDAARDAVLVAFVDPAGILGDLSVNLVVEVDAVHLGNGHEVERDVGEFFAKVGQVLAPSGEGLVVLKPLVPLLSQACFWASRMCKIAP